MTNSRSIGSRSRLLAVAVAVCAMLGAVRAADAGGRKRVVVLDFEGPKGEKFHEDLVRLIKKTHTVVPTEKWNGAAEQLSAAALSDKNVKKVAKKLKIDAIVEGRVEKRRDEFIIRIKLRAGRSGALIGDSIDTKADGPRIDGRAQRDLKDELVGAIDSVESNHGGGDEAEAEAEADDAPAARKAKKAEVAEEEEPPAKKGKKLAKAEAEDEERPAKKSKKAEKAEDEEEPPARKGKKARAEKAEEEEEERPAKSGFSKHFDDQRGADKVDRKARKDEEDEEKPAKKTAKAEEPVKEPARKTAKVEPKAEPKADDEDKLPPKKPVKPEEPPARKVAEVKVEPKVEPKAEPKDDDEDKLPPRKPAKNDDKRGKSKQVASREDDDDASVEAEARSFSPLDASTAVSPSQRAVDAVAGLSMTMRTLKFTYSAMLRATPAGYRGTVVPGGILDVTAYPLALGHKRRDMLKDIGLQLVYDRVFLLKSKDSQSGTSYPTSESRFAVAALFRYAVAGSVTVLGSLAYGGQQFNVQGPVQIPDVKYRMIMPGAGVRLSLMNRIVVGADVKVMAITDAGRIQEPILYGAADVFGYEVAGSVEYRITPNIFARASARYEAISFKFLGTGFETNQRDGMKETQDITEARDSYVGGLFTAGYLF